MKPVKLEILTQLKDAGFKDLSEGMSEAQATVSVLEQYINDLTKDLKKLKSEFSRSTDAGAMKPLQAEISELESELKEAEMALSLVKKAMEEESGGTRTLRTQIRQLENDMAGMTEGTEEYARAMAQLGELRDRYGDISQQGRIFSDDNKNIRAVADAISGLSGAMSAGVGIASLFGASQEKLQQIQTRLQAVMATTIGLQQVAQTLNKDSYFTHVLLAGAKKKWAAAQTLLNTQLGIGVGLSKALMISGVGLLLAGIAALIATYGRWKKKQEEINALKQQFINVETDTAKAMAKSKVEAEQLHRIAKDQTKDYEVREKAIDRLKSLMSEYNGHINKEGVLIDNANTSLKNYLVTLYKVEKAKKLLAGIEEDQGNLDAMRKTGSKELSIWEQLWIGLNRSFDPKAGDEVMNKLITNKSKQWVDGMTKLEDSIKEKNKSLEELINDKTIFNALFGDGNNGPGSGPETSSTRENRLAEMRLDAYRKIRENEISLMKEGEEKRKEQTKQAFGNRLDEIKRDREAYQKHIDELRKAKIPISDEEAAEGDKIARKRAIQAKRIFDEQLQQIDAETARNYAEIQNEIKRNFAGRLQAQLSDIDDYYSKLVQKAGNNAELLEKIDDARVRERRRVTLEAQLHEIEIENDLALRRQELDNKQVLLATDRQEKLKKIELAGAREKLAKLEEMQRAGMDVSEDLKSARFEVKKLSAELKKMPVDRVREIGGHLKEWLSTIAGVGGDLGESLSALAQGVDDIMNSLKDGATTFDQVGIAISGLTKLYSLAARQIEENKQGQEEWNKKIVEAAHKARMLRIEEKAYRETNVFGIENPYAKAIAGAMQYGEAMKSLNASLNKLKDGQVQVGSRKVISAENIVKGTAAGAGVGAAIGSIIPGVGTVIGSAIGGFLGGIFGATQKKVVPVLNTLSKRYGDILKKGTETFELNPKILEDYSKLDDATKQLIDNWGELRKKALEAQEQMRQTFKDLAGDIGNALSSSLINSFRNNNLYSAVDEFHDKISGTIEKILEKVVFSAHFQKMFDELSNRMEKSIDGGDGDIVDDIVWFSEQYKSKIADYGRNMEQVREEMKKQGFDLFKPQNTDGRSAVQKGIAQASQDSIDETNGRLTNMQGSLLVISSKTTEIASSLYSIFTPLNRIADNTDRLEAIETEAKKTREVLEKMDRDGMYLKH